MVGDNLPQFTLLARNLGFYFDVRLRFKEHITLLIRKAYNSITILYKFRNFLDQSVRWLLCDSLVLTHFNFSDVVYNPYLDAAKSAWNYVYFALLLASRLNILNWLDVGYINVFFLTFSYVSSYYYHDRRPPGWP